MLFCWSVCIYFELKGEETIYKKKEEETKILIKVEKKDQ